MAFEEFTGELDAPAGGAAFVPFSGELDAPAKNAAAGPAAKTRTEPVYDPVSGAQIGTTEVADEPVAKGGAVADELGNLRDSFFTGVDNTRAAIKTVNMGIVASHLKQTTKRLQDLEARGEGDSINARLMRDEIASAKRQLPSVIGEMTEAQGDAQRGAALSTRPAVAKVNAAKTFGEAWEAFKEAPYDVIAGVTATSLPSTLPALAAAAVMGPGVGAMAMGASSAAVEGGSSLADFARDAGVDVTNGKAVEAFFTNPENLSAAMTYAGKRAGIIGTLDAVSGGMAGKTIAPALKSKIARQAVNLPAQMTTQASLGAGGEALGQLATKGEIDQPGQVLMEAAGELGGAPMEVVAFSKEARDALRPAAPVAAPQVDPIAEIANASTVDEAIAAATRATQSSSAVDNIGEILKANQPPAQAERAQPAIENIAGLSPDVAQTTQAITELEAANATKIPEGPTAQAAATAAPDAVPAGAAAGNAGQPAGPGALLETVRAEPVAGALNPKLTPGEQRAQTLQDNLKAITGLLDGEVAGATPAAAPVEGKNGGSASARLTVDQHSGRSDSTLLQNVDDRASADAQRIGNIGRAQSFIQKGFDGLDAKAVSEVKSGMLAISENPKILDAVVKLIPVDVVNHLMRYKLTPEMLFHDPSMLNDSRLRRDGDVAIAGIDAATATVQAIARFAAERGSSGDDLGRLAAKRNSAVRTIDDRHVVTPTSDGVLGAGAASTVPAPPTVSKNSGAVQPTVSAPAAPQGKQVSFYPGKYGKGMGKEAAKLEAMRLNRVNAGNGVTYAAEEHNDPKLENPYAVVGRKPVSARKEPLAQVEPSESAIEKIADKATETPDSDAAPQFSRAAPEPASPAEQATDILDAAGVTGKDRLDVLKDVKAGTLTPEEVKAAYPAKADGGEEFDDIATADVGAPQKTIQRTDDMFALPRSEATSLEQIVADNDPGIQVKQTASATGRTEYQFTMPDGKTASMAVREHNPYATEEAPTVYGFDMVDGEMTGLVTERPGENADEVEGMDDVWIDVSRLKSAGDGAKIYNIAATYAHNNGMIFIGDPAGLTDVALRRRTEQMISSALKFGTTEHLGPHPRQVEGDAKLGVPPLKWVYGDDAGNLERMIDVSIKSTDNVFPTAKSLTYDLDAGTFRNASSGRPVPFGELAQRIGEPLARARAVVGSGAGKAQAGWRTVARAALYRAIREAASNDAGRPGRGSILDWASQHGAGFSVDGSTGRAFPAKDRIFYSEREQAKTAAVRNPSTVERVQAAVAELIGGKQLPNRLGRVVATTASEIKSYWEPQIGMNVQLSADEKAGAAQAFYDPRTKTVFLIADHIPAGDEQAVAAHELMHKHGQTVLGAEGWEKLHGVINGWANAEEGSDERAVYTYARSRVEAVGTELSSQEMFPYAVEAAIKMGVKPSLIAKKGTVARWLGSVKYAMQEAWGKVTGKPETFKTQDLVDLAFGIAQMENPESAAAIGRLESERTDPLSTPAFKAWFEDSKVVDSKGKPLRVFHGTTADFSEFQKERANPESDMGAGFYFTNLSSDVEANYAGEGPDLTAKIERRAEQIEQEMEDSDEPVDMDKARALARKEFSEHAGATMPVYLAIKNPVVIGGKNETVFGFEQPYDEETDDYGEETGTLVDVLMALQRMSYDDMNYGKIAEDLTDAMGDDGIKASELIDKLKASEGLQYATDDNGNLYSTEIIRQAFEEAGFDGIIDNTVNAKFGSERSTGKKMVGMKKGVVHYIAFEPAQVKSAIGNRGTFDPSNPDIRFSRAPAPGSEAGEAENGWSMPEETRTDKVIYNLQDGRIDLKRVQEAIKAAGAEIAERFDARQAETLYPGRVARRAETFLNVEVKPLLQDMAINKIDMAELGDYLIARHAPERNAQVAKVNPDMPDGGAGRNSKGVLMTDDAAAEYLATLPATQTTKLANLAKKVDAVTAGTRALLVGEGLEKQSTVDAWTGAYKNYVPLFKDEAEHAHPQGRGFTVKGSASKRSTGSTKEVTNVLAHVLMQREAAITRAEKNRVGLSLYGLALSNPNADFWTTIKPNMSNEQIGAELQAMGVDPLMMGVGMESVPTIRTVDPLTDKAVDRPNPMYKNLPGTITLRVNGEDRVLMLNQENARAMRMAENLKNMDGVTQLDLAGSIVGKATRWIASVNTQYNPAFGLINVTRDTLGGIVNLTNTPLRKQKIKVLANVPAALKGIARDLRGDTRTEWSDLFNQFQDDGGQTGFKEMFRTADDRAKAIEKEIAAAGKSGLAPGKMAHAVLDLLDDFNTSLENAVRLSAYKAALDEGMTRPAAAKLARELTVDFNRKGRAGREIGPLFAFFNASVQGTARTVETLAGPAGAKIIAGGLALGSLQALMLAFAGFEDDEPPEFVKSRSLIIPIGGDKRYIAIPYPLGLHVIPNTGRVLTEMTLHGGKNLGKRTVEAVGEIAGAFNPLGGGNVFTTDGALRTIAPTIIDPLIELGFNKNFAGFEIEKRPFREEGDNRPGFQRARESTQRTATGQVYLGISKAVNAVTGGNDFEAGAASPTPERIRYLAQTVGGGVLRELEKSINSSMGVLNDEDVTARGIPVVGRFYGEVDTDQTERSRYFENAKEIKKYETSRKAADKAGASDIADNITKKHPEVEMANYLSSVQRRISKLNKKAAETINDRAELKRIDEDRFSEMRELNAEVKAMEKLSRGPTLAERLRSEAKD